jgi:hypothetical protein
MLDFIQHAMAEQEDGIEWVVHFVNGENALGSLKHLGDDAFMLGNGARACYFSSRQVVWIRPKHAEKNGLFDASQSGGVLA